MRNRRKSCGCPRPNCGCPVNQIVHPVKKNVVHCCSEETVQHVHPSHTTVVNHHLVKNEHVYPHTTSYENTFNEVDVPGNMGPGQGGPGSQVGGAMSPPMAPGCSKPGQMKPMGPGKPPHGHHQCGPKGRMHPRRKPNRW